MSLDRTPRRRATNRKLPRKAPRPPRSPLFLVFKWTAIAGLLTCALGAAAAAFVLWQYGSDPNLPTIRTLDDYQPKQVTRVEAAGGEVIGELFTERRTYVPYEEIPEILVHAIISAEDASFFEHQGLDYMGILRAALANLRAGKAKQGASTITQQVVKTFVLSPERTLKRKIQEAILARRLEQALSKEEILTLYLNQINFGHGRYGVKEAARFYFGKDDLHELNPGEAALLAGVVQAPANISPRRPKNQERAKKRQSYVLEQMVRRGYLAEDEARKWVNEPIRIIKDPFPLLNTAPEWVDVARQELVRRYGEDRLDTLGGRVRTTLDLEVQKAAVQALHQGLRAYDERHKYGRAVYEVRPDKIDLELAKLARRLPKGGPKRGEAYLAMVREVHDADNEVVVDLGNWQASVLLGGPADERYNPEGKAASERFAAGDVIRVLRPSGASRAEPKHTDEAVVLEPGPEGAVVVLDPREHHVLALVGGYQQRVGDFNRATQAKRQPGSTFKPLVYAAAIASGRYTPATLVNDAPEVYDLWKPQNYKKGKFEGPVRLRHALAKSINTVSIRVLHDIGPAQVVDLAHRMGITAALPAELSLALGSGEVTPLELTDAFATLAAGGVAAKPRMVASIEGVAGAPGQPNGEKADDQGGEQAGEQVLSPEVAYVVTNMMTSVVEEGTATAARRLGLPLAGKTGTSNDVRDTWFVGMTPSYVVGVWVGFDDNQPLGRGESGGHTALPVYVDLMSKIGKRERHATWSVPPNVSTARIDKVSGLLAPEGMPEAQVYTEVFVTGTAPTEYALAPDEAAASSFVQDEYEDLYQDEAAGGGEGSADEP